MRLCAACVMRSACARVKLERRLTVANRVQQPRSGRIAHVLVRHHEIPRGGTRECAVSSLVAVNANRRGR
jgi:hypothetical protein